MFGVGVCLIMCVCGEGVCLVLVYVLVMVYFYGSVRLVDECFVMMCVSGVCFI